MNMVNDIELKDPQTIQAELAERLLFFRKQEKIKIKDITAALKLSSGTAYYRYEQGLRNIPVDLLIWLHSNYKLSYDWFFSGRGRRKYAGDEKQTLITDVARIYEKQVAHESKITSMQKQIFALFDENKQLRAEINQLKVKQTV